MRKYQLSALICNLSHFDLIRRFQNIAKIRDSNRGRSVLISRPIKHYFFAISANSYFRNIFLLLNTNPLTKFDYHITINQFTNNEPYMSEKKYHNW
jgi:hypothetical protein